MSVLSDQIDSASASIWQAAIKLFPAGYAIMDMSEIQSLPAPVWNQRVRRLIKSIGGRPYGVSEVSLGHLKERMLLRKNTTLGGCQFVKSARFGEPNLFRIVRELGRTPAHYNLEAGEDIIFSGCWRVQTTLAGKLVNIGMLQKICEDYQPKTLPKAISALPYVVRRAIPALHTLDGELIYPQLEGVKLNATSMDVHLSAQFLGWKHCFYENTTRMTGY